MSKQKSCTSFNVNQKKSLHQAVEDYIYFYNYQRFQAKLKQRAPIEYRHALAA
ncbi:IS3 family transposase [Paenibacillus glucanolyticus]|uniref:IS3 family transposase n=1 Tax=Paenibacillus glucanolyticus TaxID=59843 RepID=UPI0034CD0B3A